MMKSNADLIPVHSDLIPVNSDLTLAQLNSGRKIAKVQKRGRKIHIQVRIICITKYPEVILNPFILKPLA